MHQLLESPHQGSPLFLHKPVGCGHTQLPLAKWSCVISACVIEPFSWLHPPCCAGPQQCSTASIAMPPTCLHSCKAHGSTRWPVHPPRPGLLTVLSLVLSCNAAITPTHACVQVWTVNPHVHCQLCTPLSATSRLRQNRRPPQRPFLSKSICCHISVW